MSLRFARNLALLFVSVTSTLSAAVLSDGIQKGKDYYFAGEFKKAISQFQLAVKADPANAEPYLWLGRSYTLLADTKAPVFGSRARWKARLYLAKAAELAPGCEECRSELFEFLVDSNDPSALREATALMENMPESHPDGPWMQMSLTEARKQRSSPEYVTGMVFALPSQTVSRLGAGPARPLRQQP